MNRNIAVILSARDAGLARQLGAAAAAITAFEHSVERSATFSSKLATAAKVGFAALGVAAVVGLGMAINKAVEFEAAMRNVNSIAHLSEQQFRSMSEQVLELSTELPQSATNLAEGLYQISSSGFQGAAGLTVLEASAKAATAGISDTETAAKAIVSVLNAYGLSAQDAAEVSDILFATVDVGIVTFEELSQQLGDFIGAGAAAGIEIDELGAAFAAMTLAGIPAAESATSLNNLLRKLIKPSEYLGGVFQNLGYESGQAALDANGLYGTMELLRRATGGTITEVQKMFPEIRAARGAFALFAADGQNYARTQGFIANETNRAGATQRAFNEQMKAVGNQAKLFGNQITAAGITIGAAFLPLVSSSIEQLRKLGGTLADGFRSLQTAAAPAISAVGGALNNLGDLLSAVVQAASPAVRGVTKFIAALSIGAVTAFATALGALAGALAAHPGLLQAVTIALMSFAGALAISTAVGKLSAAFGVLKNQLVALGAANLLGNLATRLQLFATGFGAIFTTGNVKNIGMMKTAFEGLGTSLKTLWASIAPVASVAVIVGGLTAIQTAFDNAEKRADSFIDKLNERHDTDTIEGLTGKMRDLQSELSTLDAEWEQIGGEGVWTGLKGFGQILLPQVENSIVDNITTTNKYRGELDRTRQELAMWQHDISTLSNMLGMSEEKVGSFLDKIEGYDPTDTLTTTQDLAAEIREMQHAAAATTPAAEAMGQALEDASDPAITAADRVETFTAAVDAMIGMMLGVFDAETAFAEALHNLGESLDKNGDSMDAWTEKGRENRTAFSGSVAAAMEYAKQIATQTGSVKDGANSLTIMRDKLIETAQQHGMSKEAAEDYVNQLGLTPDTTETLIQLIGADEASAGLDKFQVMVDAIGQATVSPEVKLDSTDFNDDAAMIGETLVGIGQANPEAKVYMDDKPFRATAEQVELWSRTYDNSSTEAEALLNIIDPQNKYATLSEAAANWGGTATAGTANLNDNASFYLDLLMGKLTFGWGNLAAAGDAELNDLASGPLNVLFGKMNLWDNDSGTGTARVNDFASSTLNAVMGLLQSIDGYNATATVTTRRTEIRETVDAGVRPQRMPMRWGGIIHAATGTVWEAGVAYEPMVSWGERGTGGEAYIPKNGSKTRSLGILNEAASWYGMGLTPLGNHGVSSGGAGIVIAPQVQINLKPTAGVDNKALIDYARGEMRSELDNFSRNMALMLRTRTVGRR